MNMKVIRGSGGAGGGKGFAKQSKLSLTLKDRGVLEAVHESFKRSEGSKEDRIARLCATLGCTEQQAHQLRKEWVFLSREEKNGLPPIITSMAEIIDAKNYAG